MARGPPEPRTGLEPPTSAVTQPQANPAPIDGSLVAAPPPWPPYGLAKVTPLSTLKNSARNWAVNRSLNLKLLVMDMSKFLKPASRKILRPVVPNVPMAGGIRTELPNA